jgi:SAM-dependent methyltransferase
MTQASPNQFLEERRRTRRFFNRMSPLYPILERHLFPAYRRALERIDLPPEIRALELTTGTGLLAGAFSERGHSVSGLDFDDKLLKRARWRFPRVDFRHFDLLHLDRIEADGYDLVSMGYLLPGLSPGFRRYFPRASARIARAQVLVFDYCCDRGWFVHLNDRGGCIILDPAVERTYIAQALDPPCYSKKVLITNQVTTHFFDRQMESTAYTLQTRPTDGSRIVLGAIAGDVIGSANAADAVKTAHFQLFPPGARFTDAAVLTVSTAQAFSGSVPEPIAGQVRTRLADGFLGSARPFRAALRITEFYHEPAIE